MRGNGSDKVHGSEKILKEAGVTPHPSPITRRVYPTVAYAQFVKTNPFSVRNALYGCVLYPAAGTVIAKHAGPGFCNS
ncbi:hypothetical protein SBDP1_100054 [Syntrophobacter sp. SbD1]|nr:hypothetical protein SBDP1_100054 [Syntrophobacter sp. SbD1]